MEQQAVRKGNSTMTIALIVVVLVLGAVVAYLYIQRSDQNAPTQPVADTAAQTQASTSGMAVQEDTTPFDPATATKVPEGQSPEEYLNVYFEACEAGDWQTAFDMLPLGKKTSYGDADSFGAQLSGYGISAHEITEQSASDTEAVFIGAMTTSAGKMGYPWTFVNVDGTWYLKTRGAVAFL